MLDLGASSWLLRVCYFFFQAEDGIRDAQESRGLGDVYKRQARTGAHPGPLPNSGVLALHNSIATPALLPDGSVSVSYTHLTLPTIYSV